MLTILAIDTSGDFCAAALIRGANLLLVMRSHVAGLCGGIGLISATLK